MVAAGSEKLLVMKKGLAGPRGPEADAPQKFGVILTGVEAVQGDGLVASRSSDPSAPNRRDEHRCSTCNEEGPGLVQHIKAGKVDVARSRRRWLRLPARAYRGHERRAACHPRCGSKPEPTSVCIFTAALVVRKCAHEQVRAMSSSPGRRRYWSGPTPVLRRRTEPSSPG